MYAGKLSQVAKDINAKLIGEDKEFYGVSTDSRHEQKNSLFFALKGANFDGHDFIVDAIKNGACAVVTDKELIGIGNSVSVLVVADTLRALGALAHANLIACGTKVLAVTGSCGKTTTKNLIASILAETKCQYLASQKNFNNEIGLPLSLFELITQDKFAVIEMGATKRGDIEYLCNIAKPLVSIVTNIAPMHVEKFGSIDNVALTKAEIYANLQIDGTAIVNIDDHYLDVFKTVISELNQRDFKINTLTFGVNTAADFYPTNIINNEHGSSFILHTPVGNVAVQVNLLGEHNILNALAAAAGTYALGVGLGHIAAGLENAVPVAQRLEKIVFAHNITLIDDTYNAGPKAACAALDVLATFSGKKIFIFGNMLQLGNEEIEIHRQIGIYAKDKNIDLIFTYGILAKAAALAFGEKGMSFEDKNDLCEQLKPELQPGVVILVKGSRGMKMETVVKYITEHLKEIA